MRSLSAIIILVLTFSYSSCNEDLAPLEIVDMYHRDRPFYDNRIVQELEKQFSSVDTNNKPDSLYYSTVISVYNALQNGLLMTTGNNYYKGPGGIETEEYLDMTSGVFVTLPSVLALDAAKHFLAGKGNVNNNSKEEHGVNLKDSQKAFAARESQYEELTSNNHGIKSTKEYRDENKYDGDKYVGQPKNIQKTSPLTEEPKTIPNTSTRKRKHQEHNGKKDVQTNKRVKISLNNNVPQENESEKKQTFKSEKDEINENYFNSLCYRYEGLLNNMFSGEYLNDPVRNLRKNYLGTSLDSFPNERYFTTVVKTADAVERGILVPMGNKADRGAHGIMTQLYKVAPDFFEYRLISHLDLNTAQSYFSVKVHDLCGRPPEVW